MFLIMFLLMLGVSIRAEADPDLHSEAAVKEIAAKAGFDFEAASEVNANPKDTRDHPEGVWTLPPGLELGDEDKEKYVAIGESDRMTLRFRKPGK